MKVLNVRLTEQQHETLRQYAFEKRTHMTAIIRDLVEQKFISCPVTTKRLAENEDATGTNN